MFDKNFRIFLVLIIIGFIFYTIRMSHIIKESIFLNNATEPIVIVQSQKIASPPIKSVRLSLISSSIQQGNIYQVKKGDIFPIDIILTSKNTPIDGIDAHISYDPSFLEIVKIDTTSSIFATFPPSVIDKKEGMILLSALSAPNISVNENGNVASLIVKTLASGTGLVSFIFTPNDSTDTNAAEYGTGKDVLEKVENISIEVL